MTKLPEFFTYEAGYPSNRSVTIKEALLAITAIRGRLSAEQQDPSLNTPERCKARLEIIEQLDEVEQRIKSRNPSYIKPGAPEPSTV